MAQGVLPFKYEEEKNDTGMTSLAGLPVYLDLAHVIGLSESIRSHLHVRENGQGWMDEQMVLSLILLNLAGGDCVDDLRKLEKDEGFCRVLRKVHIPVKTATCSGNNFTTFQSSKSLVDSNTKVAGLHQCFA